MSTLTDLLDEIQDRADKATEGPWSWASHVTVDGDSWAVFDGSDHALASNRDGWGADASFIAHAREDVPRLVAALRAVLGAHTPIEVEPSDTLCRECSFQLPSGRYLGKLTEWPCPTVHAISEAMGVES